MTEALLTIDPESPEHAEAVATLQQALGPELDGRFEAHYAELKRLARAERRRSAGVTQSLNTTALVNELYLKFLHAGSAVPTGKHFFALAALAIRRILVDRARHRQHVRAHAQATAATTEEAEADTELLEIHDALEQLRRVNPRLAAVVTCRWFAGFSEPETAEALAIAERTVRRDWERARIWLQAAMGGGA